MDAKNHDYRRDAAFQGGYDTSWHRTILKGYLKIKQFQAACMGLLDVD